MMAYEDPTVATREWLATLGPEERTCATKFLEMMAETQRFTAALINFGTGPDAVRGRGLTGWGEFYGVRRRWFGFEPDWLFRPRMMRAAGVPPRGRL